MAPLEHLQQISATAPPGLPLLLKRVHQVDRHRGFGQDLFGHAAEIAALLIQFIMAGRRGW